PADRVAGPERVPARRRRNLPHVLELRPRRRDDRRLVLLPGSHGAGAPGGVGGAKGPRRRPARRDAGLRRVTDPGAAMSLVPLGVVSSPLTDPAAAPKQGSEGAPDAWVVLEPGVATGLDGMRPGDEIIV